MLRNLTRKMKFILVILFLGFGVIACNLGSTTPSNNNKQQYAYVTNLFSNSVSQYSIGANGVLTPLTESVVSTESSPLGITLDTAGTHAYVTNSKSKSISIYNINPESGLLNLQSTKSTEFTPQFLVLNKASTYAYLLSGIDGFGYIIVYSIDKSSGDLNFESSTPLGNYLPYILAIDDSATHAYLTTQESHEINAGTINAYTINPSNGSLALESSESLENEVPSWIALNPSQTALYVNIKSESDEKALSSIYVAKITKDGLIVPDLSTFHF